jgi:membrane protease YdiL (CAAX protease family)
MNQKAASTSIQPEFLKPFWASLLGPPWLISLLVFAVITAIRFIVIFSPWPLQELFFAQTVFLWVLPFLFLTPAGRRGIGLTEQGVTPISLLLSALTGAACGFFFFALGMGIYGYSPDNWCISIRNYLHFDEMRSLFPALGLFAIYALPAIFLNPVGEEILFRGFIQQAFGRRFNPAVATCISSLLFALLYLYIHGIWHDARGFHIRLASAALAVFLMACVGGVFTLCRALSGSLWPAIAAHAAFNLALLAASINQFIH